MADVLSLVVSYTLLPMYMYNNVLSELCQQVADLTIRYNVTWRCFSVLCLWDSTPILPGNAAQHHATAAYNGGTQTAAATRRTPRARATVRL